MALNTNLHQAARAKKDEFYTQLGDIENELRHYKEHFRDKIVYCNCDDPTASQFFHYFSYNFKYLARILQETPKENRQGPYNPL